MMITIFVYTKASLLLSFASLWKSPFAKVFPTTGFHCLKKDDFCILQHIANTNSRSSWAQSTNPSINLSTYNTCCAVHCSLMSKSKRRKPHQHHFHKCKPPRDLGECNLTGALSSCCARANVERGQFYCWISAVFLYWGSQNAASGMGGVL